MNEKYANFLDEMIITSKEHIKDSRCKAFIMALNASWGSGKTTFINEYIARRENNKDFFVIKYDAWENDYWDNAFEPFMYAILNSKYFKSLEKKEVVIKSLLKIIGKMTIHLGKEIISEKLGKENVDKMIERVSKRKKDIHEFLDESKKEVFKKYQEFTELLKQFKKQMEKVQEGTNKKIVVFIDELDRCKPDFAIKTLEFVKHIFDIPNFCFILSIDLSQLAQSMKVIYGQEMDTQGYLKRFFDYTTNLVVNYDEYKKNYIRNLGLNEPLSKTLKSLMDNDTLSYRDIQYFDVSLKLFFPILKDEKCVESYTKNLLALIYLKTIHPSLYNDLKLYANSYYPYDKQKKFSDVFGDRRKYYEEIIGAVVNKLTLNAYLIKQMEHIASRSLSGFILEKIEGEDLFFKGSSGTVSTHYTMLHFSFFEWKDISSLEYSYDTLVFQILMDKLEVLDFVNKDFLVDNESEDKSANGKSELLYMQ